MGDTVIEGLALPDAGTTNFQGAWGLYTQKTGACFDNIKIIPHQDLIKTSDGHDEEEEEEEPESPEAPSLEKKEVGNMIENDNVKTENHDICNKTKTPD